MSIYIPGPMGLPRYSEEGSRSGTFHSVSNSFGTSEISPTGTSTITPISFPDLRTTTTLNSISNTGNRVSPNPYSRNKTVDRHGRGMTWTKNQSTSEGCIGFEGIPLLETDPTFEDADNNAFNSCLSKLQQEIKGSDLEGLTIILEATELKDLWEQAREAIKALKTARVQKAIRALRKYGPLRAAADAYIIYTFAIAPLWQSINDIQAHLSLGGGFAEVHSATSTRTINIEKNFDNSYFWLSNREWLTQTLTASVRYKMGCSVAMTDISAFLLAGSGLLDPSSFYAVMPLSFVVDWFYNIGGYLNSLSYSLTTPGVSIKNSYVTRTTSIRCHTEKFGFNDVYHDRIIHGTRHRYINTMDRTVISGLSLPRLPSFSMPSIAGQWISLAALAVVFNPK